jgi:hypothetical protein
MKKSIMFILGLLILGTSVLSAQSPFRRNNSNQTYDVIFRFNTKPSSFALDGLNIPNPPQELKITMGGGQHTVSVNAPGFRPYNATINVSSNMTMDIRLEPNQAEINIDLSAILNRELNNPMNRVRIYLDGEEVGTNFTTVGQKTIRIESGGFVYEVTQRFERGNSYTIRPRPNLIVIEQ